MNERINNLIDQTGFGSYAEIPDTYIVHKNDLVDFAELIVRECGIALSPMLRDMVSRGQAYELIKQHFGVEK